MQSLNNISTSIAGDCAAGGSSAGSARPSGADFAAMLSELSANEQKGLNGIFSAIAKIHATDQGIGARLPLSSSRNSHTASNPADLKHADKTSSFEKTASRRSDMCDDDESATEDDDEKEHVSAAYDDTCQWMSALLGPAADADECSSDGESLSCASADENADFDILSGTGGSDKSKNGSTQVVSKQQNTDENTAVLQDCAESLPANGSLQDRGGIRNEDSSLAYMMAQSGVKDLRISDSSQQSLLDKNAEELGLIDDSLHALQDIDNSNLSDNSGDESENLNYVLSQLRESPDSSDVPDVNTAASALADELSSSDTRYQGGQEDTELTDEISGAAQGLSDARILSRENRASQLRSDMLTLSADVRKNAEEISKAVMTMAARNMKRFTFDLNPNGLGRMEISIDADESDRAVSVTIAAQETATRRLVSQSIDALRLALNGHGVDARASMSEFTRDGNFNERQQERSRQENTGILFAGNSPEDEDVEALSAVESADDDGALNLFA